jgi:class 3 adenylate cyclase/tetratricopeptide (TPR) repeat protein
MATKSCSFYGFMDKCTANKVGVQKQFAGLKLKMNSCLVCFSRVSSRHRFCPKCGALNQANLKHLNPRRLLQADKSTKKPQELEILSERKVVSVMFVDLCDSTSYVSHSDPDEARTYLEQAVSLMTKAVEKYGGTVSQLLGDGLLALFGAPVAQENHALRACLAALEMLEHSRTQNSSNKASKFVLRVGIHSGEVIVGLAGQHLWSLYRADGNTVHIASRLEKLAKPATILISSTTQSLISAELDTESLGMFTIRGSNSQMELYVLTADAQRSLAAPLARKKYLSPMIGRLELIEVLNTLADSAKGGMMNVVGLRGEAGVGKSRLITEWQSNAIAAGFKICSIQAKGYAVANAYDLVSDIFKSLITSFDVSRSSSLHLDAFSLAQSVPNFDRRYLSVVNDMLGIGVLDEAWIALSPNIRRNRIAETLHWLVTETLHTSPLLLVLEDIFLTDRESQRVLEIVIPRLRTHQILVCMSYRQDFVHRWIDESWFTEHWVAPLSEPEILVLLHGMLGQNESISGILNTLAERAGGNPFFVEQLAITLIDEGIVVGMPGDYIASDKEFDMKMPSTITNVISARVDRLSVAIKITLEAASVLRDPISCHLIGAINSQDALQIDPILTLGVEAGFLSVSDLPEHTGDQKRFTFRHALVQEVIYAALPRSRRRTLHKKAFFALSEHLGEKKIAMASMLMRHAFLGEEWQHAATLGVKAMSLAVFRSANREALRLFEMGLDAARRETNQSLAHMLEINLLLEAISALMPLGQLDTIFVNLERANQLAKIIGDQRCQATVALQMSVFLWMRGRYSQGLEFATQALSVGLTTQRRNLQMAARQSKVMIFHGLGCYKSALTEISETVRDFQSELSLLRVNQAWATAPIVNLYSFHASTLWRLGDCISAQACLNKAYASLEAFDHAYSKSLIDFVQAQMWIEQGKYVEAETLMRGSVADCKVHDIPTILPCSTAMLGAALAHTGRQKEAIDLLQTGLEDKIYSAGGTYGELFMLLNLGIAYRYDLQFDKAIDLGLQAVEFAIGGEQYGHSAEALFHLALSYLACNATMMAQTCLMRAQVQAEKSELAYYKRHIALALAKLPAEGVL